MKKSKFDYYNKKYEVGKHFSIKVSLRNGSKGTIQGVSGSADGDYLIFLDGKNYEQVPLSEYIETCKYVANLSDNNIEDVGRQLVNKVPNYSKENEDELVEIIIDELKQIRSFDLHLTRNK